MKKDNITLLKEIVPESFYTNWVLHAGIFKDQFDSIDRSSKLESLLKQLTIKSSTFKKNLPRIEKMIESEITFSMISYEDFIQKLCKILNEDSNFKTKWLGSYLYKR